MDRAVFGTAFASYARSLCSVARFSLSLDRDDKGRIIFRDPFDCAALATPSPLAQGDRGGGIRRLAQAVPFSMGMTAKRFKTNFKLLRFNKQKRQARGLAFFNYGIRACDRAASPPGPSEIQSWAFRNSRSEMPAKREYYHSSLFFACISPTAPQAMTPRRMAASTTNTMICQSGMRYPITSPFMALELASE